jgi:polygalacturonase
MVSSRSTLSAMRFCKSTIRPPLLLLLAMALLLAAQRPLYARSDGNLCDPMRYGAHADGVAKDTRALQRAIEACAAGGGGTVRLASGTFLIGPIILRSHIRLEIEPGATLVGSQDKEDYPETQELREAAVQPLIQATGAEDITITGGGTIDGAGQPWWQMVWASKAEHKIVAAKRPRLLVLDHCKHVLIDGVTIRNSASWQVVPYYSDDVTIRNGKILAPANSPNTDGIDPFSSHHVTISHMLIDVGDDNVAIKSGQPGSAGPDDPSTDITITDCTFLHGHGLSIGSEVSGGVERVRAARITFKDTGNGVRIKSNRDRGNNIGDLDFRDLTMDNVQTPILVTEYYPKIPEHDSAQPISRLTPHFHDISIANLRATGAKTGGVIVGLPESPITSIALTDVDISAQTGLTVSNATVTAHGLTVRPETGPPITLLENAKIIGGNAAGSDAAQPDDLNRGASSRIAGTAKELGPAPQICEMMSRF